MYWGRRWGGGQNFSAQDPRGGKNVVREFRGGPIFSAHDFRICTAPPAVNNDRSLIIQFLWLFQERLLLSVLPKHVADEMINDLSGTNVVGPFRKMYMNRYENVR